MAGKFTFLKLARQMDAARQREHGGNMEREITQDEGYRRGEKTPPADRVIGHFTDGRDPYRKAVVKVKSGEILLVMAGPKVGDFIPFTISAEDVDDLIKALKRAQEATL